MKYGFTLYLGNKIIFQESDKKNICKSVVEKFIDKIGEVRKLDPALIERCKNDKATIEDLKRRIRNNVTLEEKQSEKLGKWYSIWGDNFGGGYNPEEVIIF